MTSIPTTTTLVDTSGASSTLSSTVARVTASKVSAIGAIGIRFALVAVIAWIALMKFTAYEAEAIAGLVQNSPFMGWIYNIMSVRAVGVTIGVVELSIALMIGLGVVFARVGAVGAALAAGMFLTTLSFIVTTPGVFESSLGGFPALSVLPGQFLIKDLVLLGASIWLLGQSLRAIADR